MGSGKSIGIVFVAAVFLFWSCDLFDYGKLGGADQTTTYLPKEQVFTERMDSLSGIWYSRYAGIGRLDGYRIGKWTEFHTLVPDEKLALFPDFTGETYTPEAGSKTPDDGDYFVFYDGSVYGEGDGGTTGGNAGSGYCGIARALNVFNGDPKRGAMIVEYLRGCAPEGNDAVTNGELPFFGVYFRELSADTVQMANAADLAALYAGEPYHTEKKTLGEAVAANGVENEAEFISWGVVIPQNRE